MNISDILPIILCSSIIGLLVGLFAKVISNNIQKNVLIYTMKVVLRETIIYPLFFLFQANSILLRNFIQ